MIADRSRKGTKRQRTRQKLIDIAAALFARHGIRETSLVEIAAAAEMTTGAIYSNFAGKDELVLAVMLSQDLMLRPELTPDMDLKAVLRAIGKAVGRLSGTARRSSLLIADYHLYALSSPALRRRISALFSQRLERLKPRLKDTKGMVDASLSPAQLVLAIEALSTGFIMQSLLTPEHLRASDITAAFCALAN